MPLAREVSLRSRRLALCTLLGLPEPVRRALTGPPITVEDASLDPDTQMLIRLMQRMAPASTDEIDLAQMREGIDAGMAVTAGAWTDSDAVDLDADGIAVRVFTPHRLQAGPSAAVVFFHGGGFVTGSVDSYDGVCRFLCEQSGARLISVEYRLAPEHPYPAAYDDALAGFAWVHDHAAELGVDPDRIAVAGDSAGGNLAAAVALTVLEDCAMQILMYPATTATLSYPSRTSFGSGFLLTSEFIDFALKAYAGSTPHDQFEHPTAAPLHAEVPHELAPAYVATAGFDPLRDEGEAYADKLAAAGVATSKRRFSGQIHGFISLVGVSRSARAATAEIAEAIAVGLDTGVIPTAPELHTPSINEPSIKEEEGTQ